MNLPVLSNSSTCDAVAPYAGPFALLERVKIATSPFELTATPDTSPTFMSGGSFRKLTLPSNGISGTGCCANDVAARSSATRVMARHFMAASYGGGQYGDRRRADQALSAGPLS